MKLLLTHLPGWTQPVDIATKVEIQSIQDFSGPGFCMKSLWSTVGIVTGKRYVRRNESPPPPFRKGGEVNGGFNCSCRAAMGKKKAPKK